MTQETIILGKSVYCDLCGDDFTRSDAQGGLLFQSKACCPTCAAEIEKSAKQFGETHLIRGRCPDGMTFRDWCLSLRGGNNTITIHS